jgi:hypothetical protein
MKLVASVLVSIVFGFVPSCTSPAVRADIRKFEVQSEALYQKISDDEKRFNPRLYGSYQQEAAKPLYHLFFEQTFQEKGELRWKLRLLVNNGKPRRAKHLLEKLSRKYGVNEGFLEAAPEFGIQKRTYVFPENSYLFWKYGPSMTR